MKDKNQFNSFDISILSESITQPLWVCDLSGKIIYSNNAFANFWLRLDQVIPENISQILNSVSVNERSNWDFFFKEALEGKKTRNDFRIQFREKDYYFEISANPFFDQQESLSGSSFICIDITERIAQLNKGNDIKNTIQFLEKTALDFMTIVTENEILEYVADRIHELITDCIVISCIYNETDKSLTSSYVCGFVKELEIMEQFSGFRFENIKTKVTNEIKQEIIKVSNQLVEIENGIIELIKETIPYELARSIQRGINHNKTYRLGIVRSDQLMGAVIIITRFNNEIINPKAVETLVHQASVAIQRSRAERELIYSKEKAEESDRLKSAFLANISHEIRTPVNGILGFIQLLENDEYNSERKKEFYDIMKSNSKSLLSIIEDILDISMIEQNQLKLRYENINVNQLLDETFLRFNQSKPNNKEKDIIFKLIKGLPDHESYITTDPFRLTQILNNLITNAFKFTNQGFIEFGYVYIDDFLKFYVHDTGIGINDDLKDNIFKPFVQVEYCYSRKYGGSGLGLSICKGLLKQMGGKIWVNSEPGKGSDFYFTIPLNKPVNLYMNQSIDEANSLT